MGVKLVSASGGSVEINPPATASNFVATMPAGTGNVVVNGVNGALVAATAQASTSGTSIDFTGIPSWVRRITVMFNGVSTNGTSGISLQLGDAGGIETTGYAVGSANGVVSTTEFPLTGGSGAAAGLYQGLLTLSTLGSNIWVISSNIARSDVSVAFPTGGSKTLSDVLTQVRLKSGNGTDAFDAGSINIMYE